MENYKYRSVSVVVPIFNEEGSIEKLTSLCQESLEKMPIDDWEIVYIDDGSTDNSWTIIKSICSKGNGFKGVSFKRNYGKANALSAGFEIATGDIIVTMDGDLQDDPKEIPRFIDKIVNGYDLVSGWKKRRYDPINKTLPSKLFNFVTSKVTGINIHDFNCGFKAYRSNVIKSIKLYGELHRYIPVLAKDKGFRIGEIEVEHHPRTTGASKYGWERFSKGFLDLLTVLVTTRYSKKPGHFFGGTGIVSGIAGTFILFYLSILWILDLGPIGTRPLFFLGILLIILSFQLISLGVLGELIVKKDDNGISSIALSERINCDYN